MKLHNKTALLTGATGGIGREVAIQLAEQGCNLVLTARDTAKLTSLVNQLKAKEVDVQTVELDLSKPDVTDRIAAIQKRHPNIDCLINCAGVNVFAPVDQVSIKDLEAMLNTNLRGTILLTQAYIQPFLAKQQACVVNIGSTFGSIGYPGFSLYSATKFGLRGFTEALRREVSGTSIKVCYVAPRATKTTMNNASVEQMNNELKVSMDDPAIVAKSVIKAMQKDRRNTFIGWPERLFVVLNSVFGNLVDNALAKQLPTIQRYLAR